MAENPRTKMNRLLKPVYELFHGEYKANVSKQIICNEKN